MLDIETLINPVPLWTSYNYVFKNMQHSLSMDPGILVQDANFNESKLKRENLIRHYRGYAVEDSNFFFVWEDQRQGWELIQKENHKINVICDTRVNASRPFHKIIPDIILRNRIKHRAQILYSTLKMGLRHKNLSNINFSYHMARKEVNNIVPNQPLTLFLGQKVIMPEAFSFKNPFYEKNQISNHTMFKYMELLEILSFYNEKSWKINSSEIKINVFKNLKKD